MKLNKLRILLLLAGLFGKTPLLGQKDSGEICLKYKEFDFYAQALVDRKQLRKDTLNLAGIVRAQDQVIYHKNNRIKGDSIIIKNDKSILDSFKKGLKEETTSRIKAEKKVKIFKNLSLILGSAAVVLLGVLMIVI